MEMVIKIARKKGGGILLYCAPNHKMHASGNYGDEKLLIDLEWPYGSTITDMTV